MRPAFLLGTALSRKRNMIVTLDVFLSSAWLPVAPLTARAKGSASGEHCDRRPGAARPRRRLTGPTRTGSTRPTLTADAEERGHAAAGGGRGPRRLSHTNA